MPDLDTDIAACRTAIAALEDQRATLGDAVVALATAPLRARLATLLGGGLQRRHVTVLFADVTDPTAPPDTLDDPGPLTLRDGLLLRMAVLVQQHGGRVLRLTGDGIKAAFGMDVAREDDADRAVRAGLAILQAMPSGAGDAQRGQGPAGAAVRVGVHTGDVALGAGVDADNTAMGAAVHIAARMQQSAPPGGLRISHDTWSHVRGLFEAEAQPPLQVKGVDAPLQTYLVRAARDRLAAGVERGLPGLRTPLVGRQAELQRLLDAVAASGPSQPLQHLVLVGDAGLGKSRLLRELADRLAAARPGLRLLTVRTQPDGLLRPWGLLRSLLALHCGVSDTDPAADARRKVVDGLAPWFADDPLRQAQLLGHLAGLDFGDSPLVAGLDARSVRDLGLAACVTWLGALARQGDSLVLVCEDLHWADDSSLDLLQHFQAQAPALPLALLMTARPPLLARRPGWVAAASLLQLGPLPPAQGDALLQTLLQRMDAVPPALAALIARQADGNPYYMEELVRRLLDDGVIQDDGPRWSVRDDRLQALRLPSTLVGLLQARLDALPAADRQAARQASVIGHVFWDEALQALDPQAPQALDALQRATIVRTHPTSDFAGTPERQFDHHLLHQVTYDTLLRAERRLGHGAAARWLMARTQGRGAEFLAMAGDHAERGGDTALAADCFAQAGKEAHRRFANGAAVDLLRRALALLALLPDGAPARRLDLLHEIEAICDTVGDRAAQQATQQEIAAVLAQHPDDAGRARLLFLQSLLADRRGDTAASLPLAEASLQVAERCGAARWAACAHGQLTWLRQLQRQYDVARGHADAGLAWVAQIADDRIRAETQGRLLIIASMVSLGAGTPEAARAELLAVLALGEQLGSLRMQLGAMINILSCVSKLARWEEQADWARRASALAQSMGASAKEAVALNSLADALCLLGEPGQARPLYERNLTLRRQVGDQRGVALALMNLADHCLEYGDPADAIGWCAQARAEPWHPGARRLFQIGTIEGHARLRLGQREAARAMVEDLLVQLRDDPGSFPVAETLLERRACQQILQALDDPRAWPMLVQLHDDVQARVARLTDGADRDRLIARNPAYRSIVAEFRQRRGAAPDVA